MTAEIAATVHARAVAPTVESASRYAGTRTSGADWRASSVPRLDRLFGHQRLDEIPRDLEPLDGVGAQAFAELEALAAHAQREGRRRRFAAHLGVDVEHRFGRQRMGRVGRVSLRREAGERERSRRALAGVDEQGAIGVDQIERVLDLQLVVVDHRQVGPGGGDAIEQRRAERVVAARVVAPAEDDEPHQSPLRPRLTSTPSASTMSTSSGIWPSA